MGALHPGHISLVEKAKGMTDFVITSIFVNPTQFNNKSDFEKYPSTEKEDIELLKKVKCNAVFIPSEKEIYPNNLIKKEYNLKGLDTVMEGKFRPGHFKGVVQVVSRLFDLVKPDKVFFGKKDFQQLTIIKYFVQTYMSNSGIEVVECETMREPDGLAMSSRNIRLNDEQRKSVALISKMLNKYKIGYKKNTIKNIIKDITETINSDNNLETEYVSIINAETLMEPESINPISGMVICTAVYAGEIRLIDNITLD